MPRYGRKFIFCLQHFSFVLRGKLQILRFTNIKNVEIVEKLDDSVRINELTFDVCALIF